MLNMKTWSIEWGGRQLSVEVGKLALLASASCTVRYGDTTILATAVRSKEEREGIDFLPLFVEFEEKLYAAGKIKGSRFIKREGRPSDEAILSARMVDRSIRPLFDDRMRNDIQVVLTALSVDGDNDAAITALVAASIVLSISSIPWDGPIAGARVGRDKSGNFILNVTASDLEQDSDLNLVVAGTSDKLVMVEAGSDELPEELVYQAMKWGSEQLKPVIELIKQIQSEIGLPKDQVPAYANDLQQVEDSLEEKVRQLTKEFVATKADSMIFDKVRVSRTERVKMVDEIKQAVKQMLDQSGIDQEAQKAGLDNIKKYVAAEISKRILQKEQRLDGRQLDEIRNLEIEVGLLPRVHGSAMFMRGDTQVLSVVTLGAPGDVQILDTMEEDGTKRYMHHYNDAPYTYGETGFMRGPGRRAIGHGALAEKALEPVLPSEDDFPYAMRVVSEVLGANGSSSMASTCGSTLSLMAAGVPIKKPIAGIAMGLASDKDGNYKILTDLQDVEDGEGGMDFKITGTADGITAMQMDTKTKGLSWQIVEETLHQAQKALKEILDKMSKVIAAPREELSQYAPRIETIKIDPEKIGDIIGPGGKTIKKITEDTGADIDIEQDGRVLITTNDQEAMRAAEKMIIELTKEVEVGEIYEGEVVRLEDFGVFVQILPNKDGMVHVSEIAWERTNKPGDVLNLGDKVKVKVKEIDNLGRVNLTMKELLPKPEGHQDRSPRPLPRKSDYRNRGQRNDRDRRKGFFRNKD